MPPDVRRGCASPVRFDKKERAAPLLGQRPNEGHSPCGLRKLYGEAKPRLTSDGVAEADEALIVR